MQSASALYVPLIRYFPHTEVLGSRMPYSRARSVLLHFVLQARRCWWASG